jgi:hypothetical protein
MKNILEILDRILNSIEWFKQLWIKSRIRKKIEANIAVDSEHDKNKESKRPDGEFWKDRGMKK